MFVSIFSAGVVDTWGEGGGSYGSPQWEVVHHFQLVLFVAKLPSDNWITQVIGCLALSWTLVAITLVKGMQVE